jgi:hypothetical protein
MIKKNVAIISMLALVLAVAVGGYLLNENKKQSQLISLRTYYKQLEICVLFNLNHQVIKQPNGIPTIIDVSGGEYTSEKIHNFNEWVKYKTHKAGGIEYLDPRIKSVGNDGIITLEDILENPEAIAALWAPGGPMDNIDDRSYHNKIFRGPDLLYATVYGRLAQERDLTSEERAHLFDN